MTDNGSADSRQRSRAGEQTADKRPTVGQHTANSRPTYGQLSAERWPKDNRQVHSGAVLHFFLTLLIRYYVNRDTLFSYHKASEVFLQRLMALYVASHYKVTEFLCTVQQVALVPCLDNLWRLPILSASHLIHYLIPINFGCSIFQHFILFNESSFELRVYRWNEDVIIAVVIAT